MVDSRQAPARSSRPAADREAGRRAHPAYREFGRALAALRKSRGLTQRQLAEMADVDPSFLSRLESGGRGVSREAVERLARALQATAAEHGELLKTAGVLPEEAVALLDEPELAQFSALLSNPSLRPADRHLLLSYLRLALRHAEALGYDVAGPQDAHRRAS